MTLNIPPKGTYGRPQPRNVGVWKYISRFLMRHARTNKSRALRGMKILALTTIGAKSGLERTTPVGYFPDGDSWLVIATAAGAINHPLWYYNIAANPDQVVIDIDGERIPVTAAQLEGAERASTLDNSLRRASGAAADAYRRYAASTDRQFPILRLTRAP